MTTQVRGKQLRGEHTSERPVVNRCVSIQVSVNRCEHTGEWTLRGKWVETKEDPMHSGV